MDSSQHALMKMVKEQPACLNDRKLLRAVLLDYLPQNRLQQNLILNAYDEDIISKFSSTDVTLQALRMIKSLSDGYGLTQEAAIWSVITWCYMLGFDSVASAINDSIPKAAATGTAIQPSPAKPPQSTRLKGGMMYIAGTECLDGNLKLESVRKNQKVWWRLYQIGSNDCDKIDNFTGQGYINVPKGMVLQVNNDVYVSKV